MRIAFIGIGIMGAPMAKHLAAAGHSVTVYNRTRAKAEATGLPVADSVFEAIGGGTQVVVTCVGDDDDLRSVILADDGELPQALLATVSGGGILIDHSTVSASLAREIAREATRWDVDFVDAPVSGGQAGAEQGTLAIMCGGSAEAMARAEPIMQAYASRVVHVGAAGAGQQTKMVNQICIAGVLGGLSEALRFAQASGLDLDRVFDAVSGGAARSWQLENRWATMARGEFDFGFAVDWMRKDLGLALAEARDNGAALPVAALVDQFYAEVQRMGGGRQDTSALVRRLAE